MSLFRRVSPLLVIPKEWGFYNEDARIDRDDREQIVFGCGAVRIYKKDLKAIIKHREKYLNAIRRITHPPKHWGYGITRESIEKLTINEIKEILGA